MYTTKSVDSPRVALKGDQRYELEEAQTSSPMFLTSSRILTGSRTRAEISEPFAEEGSHTYSQTFQAMNE